MGLKWLVVVAMLAVGGCNTRSAEIRPGQIEAMNLVWHDLLGMDGEPPPIEWVDGAHCKGLPTLSIPTTVDGQLTCTAAFYDANANQVTLMLQWPDMATSGIAHEYMHAYLYKVTGDSDVHHHRPDWDYVPTMNKALSDAGL